MIRQLLSRFFSAQPRLSDGLQQRLQAVLDAHPAHCNANIRQDRLIVLDVESSGLNLRSDRLLAIGAVAIHHGKLALADSFDVLLKQEVASDKANILIHGIGGTAQRAGLAPEEALLAFLEYLDGAPIIAFHVAFDETMLHKAFRQYLGYAFKHCWADLAYLLPELYPAHKKCHALDDWLSQFNIRIATRHNALADATATAQLALMALHQVQEKKMDHFQALQELEHAQRWLQNARY